VIEATRKYYYPIGTDKRIISGESGAAGLAGLLKIISDPTFDKLREHINLSSKSNILLFNTEGATDLDDFNLIIN
jgi:diaminopropionate ammonia-lyase